MSASKRLFSRSGSTPEVIAAEWIARRDAGWTSADERAWGAWRRADPRHAAAWEEIESSWRAFDAPHRAGEAMAMVAELAVRARRRRSRARAGAGVVLAAAACVALMLFQSPWRDSHPTATVAPAVLLKPESRVLADGSVVELNIGAAIAVNFSAARRDVRLIRGEAHFAVQKDSQRPFIVTAGEVEVRAVGTAFVIKLGANAVDVLVTEGRVAVDRAIQVATTAAVSGSAEEPAVVADAGKRVVGTVDGANQPDFKTEIIPPVEMERLLAWRGPKLELAGTPLAEAVAVFNRENQLQLIVGDPEVGGMRLSGVFRADNAEGFAQLLESHYGIVVERRGATALVLRKTR